MMFLATSILFFSIFIQAGHGSSEIECNNDFQKLGSLGQNVYYVSNTALNWHQANKTCTAYQDTYLASIPNKETHLFLVDKVKGEFWFGAHEVKFDEWRWQNDNVFSGEMELYVNHTKNTCGFVNATAPDHLGQSPCYLKKGFLCIKSEKSLSSRFERGDFYISTPVEFYTWFQAREACLCRGMDLAIGNGNSVDYLYELLLGETGHFWIGLQKTRYTWASTGKAIEYAPWGRGEPNDWRSSEDCAQLVNMVYNDVTCQRPLKFLCVWENNTHEISKPFEQTLPRTSEVHGGGEGSTNNTGLTAGVVVLTLIVIFAIFAVLIVVALRARRRDNQWGFHNVDDQSQGSELST